MKINFFEPFKPEADKLLADRYHLIKHINTNGVRRDFLVRDLHAPGRPQRIVQQFNFTKVGVKKGSAQAKAIAELFQTEAKTLSLLSLHNCIPTLLDHFERADRFYFVYEVVEGHPLKEEFTIPTPWSDRQVIGLLEDVLDTLDFIQHQEVIHMDLRPENLIRKSGDNQIAIANFGGFQQQCAQIIAPIHSISAPPIYTLTSYMADEQIAGHPQFSSDLYALGTVAIQALTGHHPRTILTHHQTEELFWPSFASLRHPALLELLERMVKADARDRYPAAITALAAIKTLPEELVRLNNATADLSTETDNLLYFPNTADDQTGSAESNIEDVPLANVPVEPLAQSSLPIDNTEEKEQEEATTLFAAEQTTEAYEIKPRRVATSRSAGKGLVAAAGLVALVGAGGLAWRVMRPSSFIEQPATISEASSDAPQASELSPVETASVDEQTEAEQQQSVEQQSVEQQSVEQQSTGQQTTEPQTVEPSVPIAGTETAPVAALPTSEGSISSTPVAESTEQATPPSEQGTPVSQIARPEAETANSAIAVALTPESAKSTVSSFYDYIAQRSWGAVRSFLDDDLARSLEPNFFYQFKDVSVENLRVVDQTSDSIELMVQNTYVYPDGSTQKEERSYKIEMINSQPTIVDTAFEGVTKDRSY